MVKSFSWNIILLLSTILQLLFVFVNLILLTLVFLLVFLKFSLHILHFLLFILLNKIKSVFKEIVLLCFLLLIKHKSLHVFFLFFLKRDLLLVMFANDLAHDIKLSSFSQVIISFLSLRELRSFEWTIQALFNYSFFIVICSLYFLL